jgi:hypothetical protein
MSPGSSSPTPARFTRVDTTHSFKAASLAFRPCLRQGLFERDIGPSKIRHLPLTVTNVRPSKKARQKESGIASPLLNPPLGLVLHPERQPGADKRS